eukprot:1106585-Prymnesium_polylepis.1
MGDNDPSMLSGLPGISLNDSTRNVHPVTGALSMRHADGEIEPRWFAERKMGPKDVAHDIAIL